MNLTRPLQPIARENARSGGAAALAMTQDEATDSDDVTNGFGFVSLILALVCAAFGFMDLVDPPFSDAELANFVDTWEPQVSGGWGMSFVGHHSANKTMEPTR